MKEEIKVFKQDHFGRGISRIENKVIFIEGALPQEEVLVKDLKLKKNYITATASTIVKASKERRKPECPYYERCGGCHLMHQKYSESQLPFKINKVKDVFTKFSSLKEIPIKEICTNLEEFYYRNKLTLHVQNGQIGLYQKNSNQIVPIKKCLICNEDINQTLSLIEEKIKQKKLIKQIIIKTTSTHEVMVIITGEIEAKELFCLESEKIKSVILNHKVIKGKDCIIEKIHHLKFKISANTFFQVNTKMIPVLYGIVEKYLKEKEYHNVLDLYCGSGTISLLLSQKVEHVTGIEVVEDAIKDAKYNATLNEITNVDFLLGKVEDHIDLFENIDLIVVDPPRSGLDKNVVHNILRIKPQTIIYVSCDPITLVRDIEMLKEKYSLLEVTPVDMFPNTYHVECVCVLNRR